MEPSVICFAMMKSSYSGEMLRSSKKAILTTPGESLVKSVMSCGSSSERNMDNVHAYGIEMMRLQGEEIAIPAHRVAAFVCKQKEFIDVGDHYFHVCNACGIYENTAEKPLFACKGHLEIA